MNLNKTHRIPKFDYLILLPIMALAFYMAFIPHQGYPYPLHIDGWMHLAYSDALLKAGSTTFNDPFFGSIARGLSSNLEAGFHLFWGIFHQISGISWLTIFRYFPSITLVITVLAVWYAAQQFIGRGFYYHAILWAGLIVVGAMIFVSYLLSYLQAAEARASEPNTT